MGLKVALGSQPINQPPLGSEYAPAVRPIARKTTVILNPGILAANLVYASPWYDTNVTGDNFVTVRCLAVTAGSISNGLAIIETDDPGSAGSISSVGSPLANLALMQVVNTGTVLANTETAVSGFIRSRYWRIVYSNGGGLSGNIFLSATSSNAGAFLFGQGTIAASAVVQNLPVAILQNGSTVDAQGSFAAYSSNNTGSQQTGLLSVGSYVFNGTSYDRQRTPAFFQNAICIGGFTTVWNPTSGKRPRLMKYQIEMGADATMGAATPLMLGFSINVGTATGNTMGTFNSLYPMHRVIVPTTAIVAQGEEWTSGWIDLGNGQLSTGGVAGVGLNFGINIAQSTAAITPTWTITSNQWEAITLGFKSPNNAGGFRVRQVVTASGVASATTASLNVLAGSLLIMVARTTNVVGGVPTIAATDSGAAQTWVNNTKATNATDGANGSSLQVSYALNAVANVGETFTMTGSVNVPTVTDMIFIEVVCNPAITVVASTAQSTATGNSTAPASTSFTPGEAGNYILNVMATAATLAAAPTIATYRILGQKFTATGAISVSDNWGNGTLSAGAINIVTCGTEE